MARIKLELPESFQFSTELSVRISDINYGRHLGNDAVLALIHEARIQFLAKHGYSEADVGGVGLIMTDAVLVYKSQAFYGDRLKIEMQVADPEKSTFDFMYRVTHLEKGHEIARVKTGMAFFDYEKNRIARMPEPFAKLFFDSP
jgi:acyl-CoA thioester hydrolase